MTVAATSPNMTRTNQTEKNGRGQIDIETLFRKMNKDAQVQIKQDMISPFREHQSPSDSTSANASGIVNAPRSGASPLPLPHHACDFSADGAADADSTSEGVLATQEAKLRHVGNPAVVKNDAASASDIRKVLGKARRKCIDAVNLMTRRREHHVLRVRVLDLIGSKTLPVLRVLSLMDGEPRGTPSTQAPILVLVRLLFASFIETE